MAYVETYDTTGTMEPTKPGPVGKMASLSATVTVGVIGEVVVLSREISATQQSEVEQYLIRKWGIS